MTVLWSIAAVICPCWGAYTIVCALSRSLPDRPATTLLRICLALGFGWGLSACTYYLWRILFDGAPAAYMALDSTLWLTIALVLRKPTGLPRERRAAIQPGPSNSWLDRRVAWSFAAVLAVAAAGMVGETLSRPYGGWDAWGIWNLRARHLYSLDGDWRQAFSLAFTHVDYPLLVPATVARWWTYLGTEPVWVSAAVALAFTAATTAVVIAGISLQRGRNHGLLAGMVLLGTVRFLRWGAAQYSDVPVAFFFLAALLLLILYDDQRLSARNKPGEPSRPPGGLLVLSGLAAGLAAWTKNEGLLFCAVLLTARATTILWRRGWRQSVVECLTLAAGAAPVLAIVAWHKLQAPVQNDIVGAMGTAQMLARFFDPVRLRLIAGAFVADGVKLLTAFLVVIPLCFLLLGRYRNAGRKRGDWVLPAAVTGLMLAGYCAVYLTSPHDLEWHLSTSFDRLLVQLWPMAVCAVFLQLQTLDAVWPPVQRTLGIDPIPKLQ